MDNLKKKVWERVQGQIVDKLHSNSHTNMDSNVGRYVVEQMIIPLRDRLYFETVAPVKEFLRNKFNG